MKDTTWKWLSKTIEKKAIWIVVLSVLQAINAACGIVFALFMRKTIDGAVAGQKAIFWQGAWVMIGIILTRIVTRAAMRFLEEETRAVIDNNYRGRVFRALLHTEYGKTSSYHSGELMNRMTSDVQVVTEGMVSILPTIVGVAVHIVGVFSVLYMIHPLFTAVFLVGGCLVAAASILPRKLLKNSHRQVQEKEGQVRSFIQECLESLLIIGAFGCENKMEQRNEENMQRHRLARRHRNHISNFFNTGMGVVIQGGYLFGFVVCGYGILNGSLSYGTLTAVIQLVGQIQTPFLNLGAMLPKYSSMMASAERLMELTEGAKKPADSRKQEECAASFYEKLNRIVFSHVDFSYDGQQKILQDTSFEVEKGEFVGLIGTSGIGKSTIMKLLLGVYPPEQGEIYFACTDAKLGAKCVQASQAPAGLFAYVPQGNHLMSGTIRQVVGFAEQGDEISEEKVRQACYVACAEDFIEELPQKYDTVLGERGAGLSEGQMQRLAVARAIYSGCPILLLDEATASLDSVTERMMMQRLRALNNRTVFLITHRKEAWSLCDRVLERKECLQTDGAINQS